MSPLPPSSAPDPLDALFARARVALRANTAAAEYAFETRLLARLRAKKESHSPWALVSWRLAPILAAGVLLLALWQGEVTGEANDAAQVAYMEGTTLGVDGVN